jgi:hypothetical protein
MSIRARDQTFAKKSPGLAGLSVQSRAGASHLDDIKYAPMYANVIVASCINEVCLCLVARVDARCHGGAERAQRIMIQFLVMHICRECCVCHYIRERRVTYMDRVVR